jgi:hypothetical protein
MDPSNPDSSEALISSILNGISPLTSALYNGKCFISDSEVCSLTLLEGEEKHLHINNISSAALEIYSSLNVA